MTRSPLKSLKPANHSGAVIGLLALGATLVGCDRQPENASHPAQTAAAKRNPSVAAPPEVEAYLAQFNAGDPEACFKDPDLVGAHFQEPDGAAAETPVLPARVIVAIDASGSMAGKLSGVQKLTLARTAAATFVEKLPTTAEAGLLVFGQAGNNRADGKSQSCATVDVAVPMTRDRAALSRAVGSIRAVGWTPLASALKRAEAALTDAGRPGEQIIYIVSDGEETCGGDPVAVARAINHGPTRAIINIIGFAVPSGEATSLAAVATAGGGTFVNAKTDSEIDAVAARIREEGRMARNRLTQSGAVARNTLASSGAAAKARICTSGLIAKETLAVSSDLAKKRIAGKNVSLEERAETVMAERHAALERRTEAFANGAVESGNRANDLIDANAAQAR